MRAVVADLEGAFTLLAIHADQPGVVVGARRNSPLVVGLGDDANYLGSDVAAFIGYTRHALELAQDQIVTITPDGATVIDFDGTPAEGTAYEVTWDAAAAEKGGYATFMEKEIHDQPHAVADTLLGRTDAAGRLVLDELRISEEQLRAVDRITIVACGTAAYAGMVAKYAIEHWTPHPRRGRARPRVPLLRPHRQRAHARRVDQPVRRDDGHAHGGQARPRCSAP